jgi:hypothetical protein
MKELYEVPEIHEVGAAEIVVQGAKDPLGNDGAVGINRLDPSAYANEE